MKKNWRNKIIALLVIALIAIAFAAPVNALTIASNCNNEDATSCNSNILYAIGVCPSQTDTNCAVNNAAANTNTCTLTGTQTTTNCADNQNVQKAAANTAASKSFSDYWTKLLNSIKQNNNVITNPTAAANTNTKPTINNNTTTTTQPTTTTTTTNTNTNTATTKPTTTTNNTTTTQPTTTTTTQSGLSAQEQQMVNLVNNERAKAGLKPLAVDTKLSQMARVKSQDMADNNYFSHTSPTYGSPFDMMKKFGISYRTAGENIALNSSVEKAHTALMNSEGHRANILNPNFTHIGIGIVSKGGSLYFTQEFIGK